MKSCNSKNCTQINPQALEHFYKNIRSLDGLHGSCKICHNRATKKYAMLNPSKIKEIARKQYNKRKILQPEYEHKSYLRNRATKTISMLKYRNKHKATLSKARVVYQRTRRNSDSLFKLITNLRSRMSHAVKRNQKAGSAVKDLGCTIEHFKKYIEQKFQIGMSWENYGRTTWHLDHIIPLDHFDLTNRDQFLKACHYMNYQPLWAKDNCSKSNKII